MGFCEKLGISWVPSRECPYCIICAEESRNTFRGTGIESDGQIGFLERKPLFADIHLVVTGMGQIRIMVNTVQRTLQKWPESTFFVSFCNHCREDKLVPRINQSFADETLQASFHVECWRLRNHQLRIDQFELKVCLSNDLSKFHISTRRPLKFSLPEDGVKFLQRSLYDRFPLSSPQ